MIIYNLFPRLVGRMSGWGPHFERAVGLGFDTVFLNPIQQLGASRSLYSIADARLPDPEWCDPAGPPPVEQVRTMIADAHRRGLRVMMDLVINHTAVDAPLVREHPEWYAWENGAPAHPGADENGHRVVWHDLARLNWAGTRDSAGLTAWAAGIILYWAELGVDAFRCDAAYQIPPQVWSGLIRRARERFPNLVFAAETLGCTPTQTLETARAGFGWVFNSSKWWDLESPWLMEQYQMSREVCDSISFPESHDTPRLAEECGGHLPMLQQRYLFSALFSGAVILPAGFEFGFRRRMHVVQTQPGDWETPQLDLSGFIRRVNSVKSLHRVFQEDGPMQVLPMDNPRVLVLWKASRQGQQQAVIFLNKDLHQRQPLRVPDPAKLFQVGGPVRCVSPENPLDFVPVPFEYDLRPGEAVVLVSGKED